MEELNIRKMTLEEIKDLMQELATELQNRGYEEQGREIWSITAEIED